MRQLGYPGIASSHPEDMLPGIKRRWNKPRALGDELQAGKARLLGSSSMCTVVTRHGQSRFQSRRTEIAEPWFRADRSACKRPSARSLVVAAIASVRACEHIDTQIGLRYEA